MVNTDEEIGRMVGEYDEVRRRLVALRACIERRSQSIKDVGFGSGMVTSIRVDETGFSRGEAFVPFDIMETLKEDLADYRRSLDEKIHIEQLLRDACLGDLIQAE